MRGLIIKGLEEGSEYQPSRSSFSWLKLKKDYLDTAILDSLDLVPIGAQYGKVAIAFFGTDCRGQDLISSGVIS